MELKLKKKHKQIRKHKSDDNNNDNNLTTQTRLSAPLASGHENNTNTHTLCRRLRCPGSEPGLPQCCDGGFQGDSSLIDSSAN